MSKEAMSELEAMRVQAEIETQNKRIVREIVIAIDEGNPDKFREYVTADFICHFIDTPDPIDVDATIQGIKAFYEAFPDLTHVIDEMIAEANKVAVRFTQHGTHTGDFEGIPGTGRKVVIPAMHTITFVDGKIKEWRLLEDNLGLMTQLGMELAPKESEK